MAEKQEFPILLEKDGVKRHAHSLIAYNQLKTQGFTEGGSKQSQKKQGNKQAESKPAESKTETKADKAKAEDK